MRRGWLRMDSSSRSSRNGRVSPATAGPPGTSSWKMPTVRMPGPPERRAGPGGWLMEDGLAGLSGRRARLGYVFVLPTLLGILVCTAGPVIVSLGLSLFEWNVFDPPAFTALDNYQR